MPIEEIYAWASNPANIMGTAQVAAAFVTAIATIALWRVTRVLATETASLAKMTARPFVICYMRSSNSSPTAMELSIENTGNATAFDIKLKVTPAVPRPDPLAIVEADATTFEVSLLPPGKDLPIQGVLSTDAHDLKFFAEVSWSLMPQSIERDSLSYQFRAADGFRAGWRVKGLHEIAEQLEKMRR